MKCLPLGGGGELYSMFWVEWWCGAVQPLSCVQLCGTMDCSPPDSSSVAFPRQEYWSGMPCPPPGNLPDTGIKPESLVSHTLPVNCLPWSHRGSPIGWNEQWQITSHTEKRKKKPCFNSIYKVNWKILKTYLIVEKEICIFKNEIRLNTLTSRKVKFLTKT